MATAALHNISAGTFDRLLSITIGISAVTHVVILIAALVVPSMLASPPPQEEVIKIEMLVKDLPKGPNIGTQAPIKSQTAARTPDHSLPWKKKKEKVSGQMAMKKKTTRSTQKKLAITAVLRPKK